MESHTGESSSDYVNPQTEESRQDTREPEPEPKPKPEPDAREESQTIEEIKYAAHVVNRSSDIRKKARELAELQLREEMRKGKWYKPMDMFRRAKLRILEEFYRQKYIQRAEEAMIANNNSYLTMDVVRNAAVNATHKIQEERQAGLAKAQMAGEILKSGEELEGQNVEEIRDEKTKKLFLTHLLRNEILNNIKTFSSQEILELSDFRSGRREELAKKIQENLSNWVSALYDQQAMQRLPEEIRNLLSDVQVRNRLLTVFGEDATQYGVKADYFASDFIELAQKIETDRRAGKFSLQLLENNTSLVLGNMTWGAETQARFNAADKFIAWAQKRKITGLILNPATIGATMSLASFAALKSVGVAGRWLLAAPGIGSVAGGLVAGIRRNYDLKVDMASHKAEVTYSANIPEQSTESRIEDIRNRLARRAELEQFAYNTATANSLIENLTRSLTNLTIPENQANVFKQIADIRARMSFSSAEGVDLITYDSKNTVEQARLALIKAIAQAKVALKRASVSDDEITRQIGAQYDSLYKQFSANTQDRDAAFGRYRIKQSIKTGAQAAVAGMAIAGAAHGFFEYTDAGKAVAKGIQGLQTGISEYVNKTPIGGVISEGIQNVRTQAKEFFDNNPIAINARDIPEIPVEIVDAGKAVAKGIQGLQTSISEYVNNTPIGGVISEGIKNVRTQAEEFFDNNPIAEISTSQDDLKNLFKTTTESNWRLSDNLSIHYDPEEQKVTFIDPRSFNPIDGLVEAKLDENGKINLPDSLPQNFKLELEQAGFKIHEVTTRSLEEGSTETVESMTTGHKTLIPEGSKWEQDGSNWDLVLQRDPSKILINNASFSEDGIIESFDKEGSEIKNFDLGHAEQVNKEVSNPTGEWKEHAKIDRYEWYSYNEPGSQLNELKLFTYKKGSTVTLSMQNMGASYQAGLDPENLNVPDLLKGKDPQGGRAAFAFSLPGHLREPMIVLANEQGLLHLDPLNSNPAEVVQYIGPDGSIEEMPLGEFSKMVLNLDAYKDLKDGGIATELYKRYDVWRVGGPNEEFGFISSGRYAMDNGQQVWQSFATIRGTGPQITVENRIKPPEISTTLLEQVDNSTVLEAPVEDDVPSIPIPFAPRYPLEPIPPNLSFPKPPVTGYYGGESVQVLREWLKNSPQSHKPYKRVRKEDGTIEWFDSEGKPVVRNVHRERESIDFYLDALSKKEPENYQKLKDLARGLTPMSDRVRVAVNIPAWMEGKNLYKLLERYVEQKDKNGNDLDPELFEINIIVNRKTGTQADNSVDEIQRFITDSDAKGKKYRINFIDVEFDPPFNNVGNARKVITDLTLLRSYARKNQTDPLYIESEDADLIHIDPKTIINIIEKMDANPHLDAVKGIQDRTPEIMMDNDFVFLKNRISEFMVSVVSREKYRIGNNSNYSFDWNRVVTGGWNTAYTAEAYAMIGGYDPHATKGEDLSIGNRISMSRSSDGENPNTHVVGRIATRSDSSPRRFIYEAISGLPAYSNSFEDESVNKRIREKRPEELLDMIKYLSRINDSNKNSFEEMIRSSYGFIKGTTPSTEEAEKSMRFVMLMAGFERSDYEFTSDGNINIKKWDNVSKALNDYRRRHSRPRNPGERTKYKTT